MYKNINMQLHYFVLAYHGINGPLHVSGSDQYDSKIGDLYGKAMEELGYKVIDCNGEEMIGMCRKLFMMQIEIFQTIPDLETVPPLDTKQRC